MSVDRNMYLGPYAECVFKVDADRTRVEDVTDHRMRGADSRAYGKIDRTFAISNYLAKGVDVENLDGAINLLSRDMAGECRRFEESFAADIEKLRVAFASVEIRWGLLGWYT